MGRGSHRLPERTREISGGQAAFLRKLRDCRIAAQMGDHEIESVAKLPRRQAAGNGTGWRTRVPVNVGHMGVEGEPDMIDKQGAALVRLLDWIEKRGRQAVHDPVLRSEATVETGGPANAAI